MTPTAFCLDAGMWQCLALLLLATVNAADFTVAASSSSTGQGVLPLDVTLGLGQSTTVQTVTVAGVTFFGPGDPRNGAPVAAGLNMDQIAITGAYKGPDCDHRCLQGTRGAAL